MAKATKKVDVKAVQKASVMAVITTALETAGYTVLDGADYGMTAGTVIVRAEACDVQIKPITPKAGVTRYEEVEAE